uniref:Uncharacterized protein n=1 Tax=Rhizophora mucronata TaxID=61149 RepID=A0A2P2Q725_RHIMU
MLSMCYKGIAIRLCQDMKKIQIIVKVMIIQSWMQNKMIKFSK